MRLYQKQAEHDMRLYPKKQNMTWDLPIKQNMTWDYQRKSRTWHKTVQKKQNVAWYRTKKKKKKKRTRHETVPRTAEHDMRLYQEQQNMTWDCTPKKQNMTWDWTQKSRIMTWDCTKVLGRRSQAGLNLNPKKSDFAKSHHDYLSYKIKKVKDRILPRARPFRK